MTPDQQLESIRRKALQIKTELPTLTGADFKNETTRANITPATPAPGIPSSTSGMVKNVADSTQNLITAQTAEAERLNQLRTEYSALGAQDSLASLSEQKLNDYGVTPEALTELKDIQLQLSDYKTDSEVRKTRIEGAGGQTLGQAQREVTQEDRENAVRSAGLASRAAVLQGNIETGRALAQDAVNIAYKDRELKNQNLINQITQMQSVVDDQTAQLLEQDKRQYEAELAGIKELKDNIASAMVSGATQAEINRLNDPMLDDAQKLALAQSITARGANEMRGLDIAEKQASIANSYSAIADRNARLALAEKAAQTEIDTENATKQELNVAKSEKALGMLQGINELINHPGLAGAIGPNPLARVERSTNPIARLFPGGELIAGQFEGNKSEFISEVERLANTLTLENMGLLKGPATDKDVEIVAASMSRLKNRDVTEESYVRELTRMQQAMQRIVDNTGITPEQAQFWYGVPSDALSEANALWATNSLTTDEIGSSFEY